MYLITGAAGQLGIELRKLLKESALYVDRNKLDISSEMAVKDFFKTHRFDGIINCAAYTAVDKAEDCPELADAVNHQGAKWLAKYGRSIIHISTDYVFDGTSTRPYIETDLTNPVSVYGQSKLAGEQAVLHNAETAVIIRTAWLYSVHRNNFLKTMLQLGQKRRQINVVSDQTGTPTSAEDLAQTIVKILPQVQANKKTIYHFTNEGMCSWYDFAVAVMQLSGMTCRINPINSKDYPTKATRPFYSVLSKDKIKQDFHLDIPHWYDALAKILTDFKGTQ